MRTVDRLVAAARAEGSASDLFDEAFGNFMGLNRTDARCADIVQRFGRLTLGELARHAGLTTGAVTTAVDRLEAVNCLQRVRDPGDRRKIFVELTREAQQFSAKFYDPIGAVFSAALRDMSDEELETVARYLELSARIHRDHAELVKILASEPRLSDERRAQLADSFAAQARPLAEPILRDWREGRLPDDAYVSGKTYQKD